jgi:hypothetical protein
MFSLSPECVANHIGERRPRNQIQNDDEDETAANGDSKKEEPNP